MNPIEKRRRTVMKKYGVANISLIPEIQEKRRAAYEARRPTILYYQQPRIHQIDGNSLSLIKLDRQIAESWLDTYHPMKSNKGTTLALGLVKNNTIYCIMTFKKSRNHKYFAELSRLSMLPTYYVNSGYDILSQYASALGVYNIVAYVNTSFENTHDYESLGMKHVRNIQRTKWWIKENQIMSDVSRHQKKIPPHILEAGGWSYAYDNGTKVYEYM